MPREKYPPYPGYCRMCVEFPPSRAIPPTEFPFTKSLVYNPWCTLCYWKGGNDKIPTGFWKIGDEGDRFFYRCECGGETPRGIINLSEFNEILKSHFMIEHGLGITDALEKSVKPSKEVVVLKYLVPNAKRQ